MVGAMSTVWKFLIALGLLLPSGAFLAGMFVASTTDPQAPRETILIQDSQPGTDSVTRSPSRHPKRPPAPSPIPSPTGDGVVSDRDERGDDARGDDRVEVIMPRPDDLDDAGDDSGRDGDDGRGGAIVDTDPAGGRDDGGVRDDDGRHDHSGGPGPVDD